MRIESSSGLIFTVIDLVTGTKIENVMWVDDAALEYAVVRIPVVIVDDQFEVDIHKVTAVRVDYVNKRIEVNTATPQTQTPWPFPTSEPKACFECCQPETCKRIDMCVAHKCRFGEDDAP